MLIDRRWLTGVDCSFILWFLRQLRDCELAPVVNRDLVRRVRNVNGITQHKQVLRNDIKLAAKLIHGLDEKGRLWSSKLREDLQSSEVRNATVRVQVLWMFSADW